MFGCIVAGRLVQTNLKQVDETKYTFELSEPHTINHVVVFMTGVAPFPEGYAASVHLLWPSQFAEWQLLGALSNDKPSVIFKLGGSKTAANPAVPCVATLGISIEPIQTVKSQQIQRQEGPPSQPVPMQTATNVAIFNALLQNLWNYCSGFARSIPEASAVFPTQSASAFYIPMQIIDDWYQSSKVKMQADPTGSFLFKATD